MATGREKPTAPSSLPKCTTAMPPDGYLPVQRVASDDLSLRRRAIRSVCRASQWGLRRLRVASARELQRPTERRRRGSARPSPCVRDRRAGLATNDLQYPSGLIGPLTTLHVPHVLAAAAGMNCWQPVHILPASIDDIEYPSAVRTVTSAAARPVVSVQTRAAAFLLHAAAPPRTARRPQRRRSSGAGHGGTASRPWSSFLRAGCMGHLSKSRRGGAPRAGSRRKPRPAGEALELIAAAGSEVDAARRVRSTGRSAGRASTNHVQPSTVERSEVGGPLRGGRSSQVSSARASAAPPGRE